MKKLLAILMVVAALAGSVQSVSAGDREWATAGKILTGVVAGAAIASAFEPAHVYVQGPGPCYVSAPAPVCVQPAPVVVYPAPVWVRPAPVVVYSAPVPVVSFSFGFGPGLHHRWHHRICR